MKSKIFKRPFLLLVAFMVPGTLTLAQQPPVPPVPQSPKINITIPDVKLDFDLDDKALKEGLSKLKVDLNNLKIELKGLDTAQFGLSVKDLDNQINLNLNNLDLNLSASLNNITSSVNLDNLNIRLADSIGSSFQNLNFSDTYTPEELKDKIAKGEAAEKIKTFSKTYNVDGNDKLRIDNRFGKVTVNTWNKNMVKVDVEVKTEASNDTGAQKLLDAVQIVDNKDGNVVSFVTKIKDNWGTGSFIWNGMTKLRKIEVNYIIYMPSRMPLDVTNRYGGTELPDMEGQVMVTASYGSLVAKSLSGADNQIRVSYGSASIDNLNSSDVNVSYGSLTLGTAGQLNANVSYGSARIGKINTSGNINIRYSSPLQINDLDKGLKSLSVNSSFSGVRVGLSGDENADFDVTVKNGSFDYNNSVSVTSKTPPDNSRGWSATKNYKGHVGKGNADKVINITTSYGSVKFD
jgi:hypothetical protein